MSYVYCIEAVGTGLVKIGSSTNPTKRLAQLQSISPVPLRIKYVTHGGELRERELHRRLAGYRRHGEWFEACREVARAMAEAPPANWESEINEQNRADRLRIWEANNERAA